MAPLRAALGLTENWRRVLVREPSRGPEVGEEILRQVSASNRRWRVDPATGVKPRMLTAGSDGHRRKRPHGFNPFSLALARCPNSLLEGGDC